MANLPIRLAMRAEGNWWVAYMAQSDTMDGAIELGRVNIGIAEYPEQKQAFMDLMKSVMSYAIKSVYAQTPDWNEPQPAPEYERSGRG